MHIYVYGSVCRGDVLPGSDVDLLAIVDKADARFDPAVYSVYSYAEMRTLWAGGNPFAWHLALESRLVYAEDDIDFLHEGSLPVRYSNWAIDSSKFRELYVEAVHELAINRKTTVFELSTVFLAVRNLAICYSLHTGDSPVFSRRAFESLGSQSLRLDARSSAILEAARILSTRGFGSRPSDADVAHVVSNLPEIGRWMSDLIAAARG